MPPGSDRPGVFGSKTPEWGLAGVYAIMVLARTTVIALIPVMAYRMLGSAQNVSELYFLASLVGIAVSFSLPNLLQRFGRWRVFLAAALSGASSAMALATQTLTGLALGLTFHVLMVLIFENVISLYILQYIPRRKLSAFEPRRILLAGITYGLGPWLGVWLTEHASPIVPLVLSAACALAVPLTIIKLKLKGNGAAPTLPATGASRSDIRRFIAQPRLRLAWLLATIRASWWCMFIVYTPIFAISSGLGVALGGFMVAIGSALLVLAPFWGKVAQRVGMRKLMIGAYCTCGLGTIATGFLASLSPWSAAGMLMASTFAMSAIDGMGNVLFLRAVRPHQRTAMTPIFTTYRDVAQVAPAGFFAVLLGFFPMPSVFISTGLLVMLAAGFCLHLPRRL